MQSQAKVHKTVVVGGGSVGLLYAARLALAGQTVTVVTRSSLQANQLAQNGISYTQLDGELRLVPIDACPIEQGLPEADLYLLTVKQTDLPAILPALRRLNSTARIIALQNGMGHHELLHDVLSEGRSFFAINTEGARRLSGTEVVHTGSGVLRVGPWENGSNSDPVIQSFVEWATSVGIQAVLEKSIKPYAWRKLMANSLINPLTALFEIPNGALLDNPHTEKLMRELFQEASAVAEYAGQKLGETDWQEIVAICRNTSRNLSSMLQDVKRHKQTEVESINGYIVKLGKLAGIPTPLHETLFRVITLKSAMGMGKEGGDSK
ncbi:ketopantoate reductase family protein [Brevibacillus reuszeri]|uniref:ketopantoate reductase family protein n=1 Tax=Brevibacillus reuszeri TaxID=54915 RepID=UPI0028976BFB|nr:2-dehydropantoate 2-reductase [Brevibacillus reuszeri]